jgi:hypothetical protein
MPAAIEYRDVDGNTEGIGLCFRSDDHRPRLAQGDHDELPWMICLRAERALGLAQDRPDEDEAPFGCFGDCRDIAACRLPAKTTPVLCRSRKEHRSNLCVDVYFARVERSPE